MVEQHAFVLHAPSSVTKRKDPRTDSDESDALEKRNASPRNVLHFEMLWGVFTHSRDTSCCTPIKYRSPFKTSDQIRSSYLSPLDK